MDRTCAVIDLGTNIFHLLIARADAQQPQGWAALHRDRKVVNLAEEGIGRIGSAAFQRGLQALQSFQQQALPFGLLPSDIWAIGTAALRTAQNADEFLRAVQTETGICPQVITGDREAELIFKGVRQAVPLSPQGALILDIGGGSVEFIVAHGTTVLWQHSFPVGATVLYHRFHRSDPIAPQEVAALERFLDEALEALWKALERHTVHMLVGAAGAFNTLWELLTPTHGPLYADIPLEGFQALCAQFVPTTLAERATWPGLSPERRLTIVVGLLLIRHVARRARLSRIYASAYSLKEGAVAECLELFA